jgi:hypothetical protein
MKYIETVPLTVHLYPKQRGALEKLQNEIQREYNIKIPLSELIRVALNYGLPQVMKDKDFILERIG